MFLKNVGTRRSGPVSRNMFRLILRPWGAELCVVGPYTLTGRSDRPQLAPRSNGKRATTQTRSAPGSPISVRVRVASFAAGVERVEHWRVRRPGCGARD
jgi:hypothetical protein